MTEYIILPKHNFEKKKLKKKGGGGTGSNVGLVAGIAGQDFPCVFVC